MTHATTTALTIARDAENLRSWPPSLKSLEAMMQDTHLPTATIPRPLTAAERSWISDRLAMVGPMATATANRPAVAREVEPIMAVYSARFSDGELAAAVYVGALDVFPTWAIAAAAAAWHRADRRVYPKDDFAFPPSPGQLAAACRALVEPIRGEHFRLRRLLDARAPELAPRPDFEARKRQVDALMRKLAPPKETPAEASPGGRDDDDDDAD